MKTRPDPRRARATLRWTCLFLVLAAVGMNATLELGTPELYDSEFVARIAMLERHVRADPERPLCLTVGTSRAALGFLPERLPPYPSENGRYWLVFNYSHVGASPALHWLQLTRLFARGLRPKRIILEVVPAHLTANDDSLVVGLAGLGDVLGMRHVVPPSRLVPLFLKQRLLLAPQSVGVLLGWEAAPATPLQELGGWPYLTDTVDADYRARTTAVTTSNFRHHLANFRLAPRPASNLRKCIQLCRAHGAEVALLLMPEGSLFRSWYSKEATRSIAGYLEELRADGVKVIDARAWLNDTDTYDQHHLLKGGAERFTARFGKEVLVPLLQPTQVVREGRSR